MRRPVPTFEWQGLTAAGRIDAGRIRAATPEALQAELLRRRITPLAWRVLATTSPSFRGPRRQVLSATDLVMLTRQLAVMVRAGLPVVRALAAVSNQTGGRQGSGVIDALQARLEAGESFAAALREHPASFPRLYCAMVAAGEATGDMEQVLMQLAGHLERAAALRRKLMSVLLYPALVVVVATLVTGGLLVFVVPVFADVFAAFGQSLPLPTRAVLRLSAALSTALPWLALCGFVTTVATRQWLRTDRGRRRADRLLLHVPLVSGVIQRAEIAKLARVLGTLVLAGVPLLESLRIAGQAAQSTAYRSALETISDRVREGEPLAESFAATRLFPGSVTQLVSIGEGTGTLDASLLRVAELYEGDLDHRLGTLTALIEPAFVAILGVVVGGILLSLYLPIFQIGGLVQ